MSGSPGQASNSDPCRNLAWLGRLQQVLSGWSEPSIAVEAGEGCGPGLDFFWGLWGCSAGATRQWL